jgi:hypothetical protein
VGAKYMSDAQRADARAVFEGMAGAGLLDFVAAWYVKAARYVREADLPPLPQAGEGRGEGSAPPPQNQALLPNAGPAPAADFMQRPDPIRCAFVSTNSITQGEQVGVLWGWLLAQGVHIHFAHRTFAWSNEARGKAAVHCVIVGFGLEDRPGKVIYEYADIKGEPHAVPAANINPYLVDGPNVLIFGARESVCEVPQIFNDSIPADGGNLILEAEEKNELIAAEPQAAQWIRPYLGGDGFINNVARYCLWLKDCPPATLRSMPKVVERVRNVRQMREQSAKAATRDKAQIPTRFTEDRQPESGDYLAIPRTSSENRTYIPIGYLSSDVIAANDLQIIPGAGLFGFGIVTSRMHMAWMHITSGRLESRFRYSVKYAYNTFPWPFCAAGAQADAARRERERAAIAQAAQGVLGARAQFPRSSLADLYDPLTMPPALLKAHQKLDAAVDRAYELAGGPRRYKSDAERVAFLFTLYQRITSLLPPAAQPRRRRKKG